jgi:hypothetical protein
MAMPKKFTMQFEEDSFFSLVAIASHESPAYIAWLLNKVLNLDFEHKTDLVGKEIDGEKQRFPVFISPDEFDDVEYTLFTNRLEGLTLVKAFPNIDYLLKISVVMDDEQLRELCTIIRNAGSISMCTPVPNDKKNQPTLIDFYVE